MANYLERAALWGVTVTEKARGRESEIFQLLVAAFTSTDPTEYAEIIKELLAKREINVKPFSSSDNPVCLKDLILEGIQASSLGQFIMALKRRGVAEYFSSNVNDSAQGAVLNLDPSTNTVKVIDYRTQDSELINELDVELSAICRWAGVNFITPEKMTH